MLRSISCVKDLKQCGQGTFGVVYKGEEKETGIPIAMKKIRMENESQGFPVTAIREIKILKALNHPNVVMLREIMTCTDDTDSRFKSGDVFLVFEYGDYDLAGLLSYQMSTSTSTAEFQLDSQQIRSFMKQLLDGISYMHKNNILHRDLKSANVLVTKDNVLKICDLGLARHYSRKSTRNRMSELVPTSWLYCNNISQTILGRL